MSIREGVRPSPVVHDVRPDRRHQRSRHDPLSVWAASITPERIARLTRDMHRAIVAHAGAPEADDALLETVIDQAVHTFMGRVGHPVAAALQMAPLMRRIGARESAMGRDFDVLDTSMRIARTAVTAYISRMIAASSAAGRALDREELREELREDLGIFLDQLREHARVGYDRQWSIEEASSEDADLALRRMLFDPTTVLEPRRLRLLAQRAGRALPDVVQPVVCLETLAPRDALLAVDLEVVSGIRPNEALVCGSLRGDQVDRVRATMPSSSVLIVGLPTDLPQCLRSLVVARQAATLLGAGRLSAPDGVLDCADVLGRIATATDPFLLDTLVQRHLGVLATLAPGRRLDMGELLLEWLETGSSVNEIARRRDQHTQTLHSRMQALRKRFGSRLCDPDQRVELILALRHALPGWRREALPGWRREAGVDDVR